MCLHFATSLPVSVADTGEGREEKKELCFLFNGWKKNPMMDSGGIHSRCDAGDGVVGACVLKQGSTPSGWSDNPTWSPSWCFRARLGNL